MTEFEKLYWNSESPRRKRDVSREQWMVGVRGRMISEVLIGKDTEDR